MKRAFIHSPGVGRAWGGLGRLRATFLAIVEAQDEIRQEREEVLMYARKR